jgi:hypothetical protein
MTIDPTRLAWSAMTQFRCPERQLALIVRETGSRDNVDDCVDEVRSSEVWARLVFEHRAGSGSEEPR